MKTEVTKTVVTVEEIISRKIVKDNGVKRSADITVERRVSANGETIHIEKISSFLYGQICFAGVAGVY